MGEFHQKDLDTIFREFQTSPSGLSSQEAEERLEKYGLNRIERKKKRSPFLIFLQQFKSVLVLLLVVAVIITIVIESYFDAAAISVILFLNAIFGFHQEYKAERSIESMKKYLVSKVVVKRNGKEQMVPTDQLVPGDIVILEDGRRIPADLRLFETYNMKSDESILTGESIPVNKNSKVLSDVPIPERSNIGYMGTLVSYGKGRGVVIGTGMKTEMGKIAKLIEQKEEPTPLQRNLDKFAKWLGVIVVLVGIMVFALGFLAGAGNTQEKIFQLLLTSISLAIAAVPEGLPAVITLTLAMGTRKMLTRHSIVKRLGAAEALGSVNVICADKTGTMTTNEMTVTRLWVKETFINVSGVGFEPKGDFLIGGKQIDVDANKDISRLLIIANNCNDSFLRNENNKWKIIGDPTEGALKVVASKANIVDYQRKDEIPFSSDRRLMTTINEVNGQLFAFSKGAPEVVLRISDNDVSGNEINTEKYNNILETVEKMAGEGLRILAFSYKKLGSDYSLDNIEEKMTFIGLVGMKDPPRKETIDAIRLTKEAGIKTIMITGDHKLTAEAIGKEIGLDSSGALIGEEIDKMGDEELEKMLERVSIFARVSPQNKLRIVSNLQRSGNIVAVTGDGVNDAPALKKADIGVAMGLKGTDVAKEASDMILLDDNFSTIVAATEEGRGIYDNIKKFIKFLLAANIGEIFIVAAATIMAFFIPAIPIPFLIPLQLLWINIVTDGLPALALSVDPKDKDIMKRKPRGAEESLLRSSFGFILAAGVICMISVLWIFMMYLPQGVDKARTMAFTTLVAFELLIVFNSRSDHKSVFRNNPFSNKYLILALISSFILQFAVIYIPFLQPIFGTVPLTLNDWMFVALFSAPAFLILPEIFIRKNK